MSKIKIGVLGGYRGMEMIKYCLSAENAEVVAICDRADWVLEKLMENEDVKNQKVTLYREFDEFLNHEMDAVVLANYAHQHAPFAIKAMKAGKHVFTEVLPCQNMKEAVELVEAVEETGMIYAYGENYVYMPATWEMKKLYEEGKIGEFEYGECEYIHNCESPWHTLTYGEPDHWRNTMFSTFYCTHSLGPIIHATGLRPTSVIGFEGTKTERNMRMGSKSGQFGIEMVTLENGAIVKSIHGGLYKNSIWYCMYGSKGVMESDREVVGADHNYYININSDAFSGDYFNPIKERYIPDRGMEDKAKGYGHDGGDYYAMWHFVEKIKGTPNADTIDVYEAMDMYLPGHFAYLSILDGGKEKRIPDLRDKTTRDIWRNHTACTDPEIAGDMLLPTRKGGTPEIEDAVYARMKDLWDRRAPVKW